VNIDSDVNPLYPDFALLPDGERDEIFARMRTAARPAYLPRPSPANPDAGFYALTRYDEIVAACRTPEVFSSEPNANFLDDTSPDLGGGYRSMVNMDDPRHARLRRIVSRAFTPKVLGRFENDVTAAAGRMVDDLAGKGPCDFVREVAARLPLEIICTMMGIPESAWAQVGDAADTILTVNDADELIELGVVEEKISYLRELIADLAAQRRENPTDDLITALVTANVDGEVLTEHELASFFRLLVNAGTETTRNAIAYALDYFTRYGDQRSLMLSDLEAYLPTAVEEIVRYATPIAWTRRNLTQDTELSGNTYKAGDRVILFLGSADRDETVFDRPGDFDITRTPNPHLGYGGAGPHFCLGAHLARREIAVLLRELFTRLPGIHATAAPVRRRSSLINGIDHLACAIG
jgi:methyl-branched lipid omega-hydroxylase